MTTMHLRRSYTKGSMRIEWSIIKVGHGGTISGAFGVDFLESCREWNAAIQSGPFESCQIHGEIEQWLKYSWASCHPTLSIICVFFRRVHLDFQNQLGQQQNQDFHNLVEGLSRLPLRRFKHYRKWDSSGDLLVLQYEYSTFRISCGFGRFNSSIVSIDLEQMLLHDAAPERR